MLGSAEGCQPLASEIAAARLRVDLLHGTGKAVMTNSAQIRLECLRLAAQRGMEPESTLAAAQAYFAFVLPPEDARAGDLAGSGSEGAPSDIGAQDGV